MTGLYWQPPKGAERQEEMDRARARYLRVAGTEATVCLVNPADLAAWEPAWPGYVAADPKVLRGVLFLGTEEGERP